MSLNDKISPIKKQKLEKYNEPPLTDYEKSEEEQAHLKFIHADDNSDILLEDWHEPMGHSLSSSSQLNVYYSSPADLECYASMKILLIPSRKAKTKHTLSTISLGVLNSRKNNLTQIS